MMGVVKAAKPVQQRKNEASRVGRDKSMDGRGGARWGEKTGGGQVGTYRGDWEGLTAALEGRIVCRCESDIRGLGLL